MSDDNVLVASEGYWVLFNGNNAWKRRIYPASDGKHDNLLTMKSLQLQIAEHINNKTAGILYLQCYLRSARSEWLVSAREIDHIYTFVDTNKSDWLDMVFRGSLKHAQILVQTDPRLKGLNTTYHLYLSWVDPEYLFMHYSDQDCVPDTLLACPEGSRWCFARSVHISQQHRAENQAWRGGKNIWFNGCMTLVSFSPEKKRAKRSIELFNFWNRAHQLLDTVMLSQLNENRLVTYFYKYTPISTARRGSAASREEKTSKSSDILYNAMSTRLWENAIKQAWREHSSEFIWNDIRNLLAVSPNSPTLLYMAKLFIGNKRPPDKAGAEYLSRYKNLTRRTNALFRNWK